MPKFIYCEAREVEIKKIIQLIGKRLIKNETDRSVSNLRFNIDLQGVL